MFKDINGYDGYKINENGIIINKKGHVMRTAISNAGYLRTTLEIYDDNGKLLKRDNKSIHRLVAETFIPNPDNLPVVMHKDNDTLHNHVSNLKWGSVSDNNRQALDDGRKLRSNTAKSKYIYNVYNDNNCIKCNGLDSVSELIDQSPNSIRPGIILSGNYKGYMIKNTGERSIQPIKFIK